MNDNNNSDDHYDEYDDDDVQCPNYYDGICKLCGLECINCGFF
jgi:hypothetical protein